MSVEKYNYIVSSDLDGTLLSKGDIISLENEEAIAEMKKKGICFVPNSGRTIHEMPEVLLKNPHIRYYIGADGAVIWDKQTDKTISLAMTKEEYKPILDILSDYDTIDTVRHGTHCYADLDKYSKESYEAHRLSPSYIAFIGYYVERVADFKTFVTELDHVEMVCSFFDNDRDMLECKARIEALGDYIVASSEPANIEIFHKRAGKGSALLTLADTLGVPHKNTIAVGDGINDMDMIEKAGLSLAMENACPELKAAAHRVICSCGEHSARYILDMLVQ